MGYERKLYVVEEWDKWEFSSVLATIDMGKCPCLDDVFTEHATKSIELLESDNEPTIERDKYGEPFGVASPQAVIHALSTDYQTSHYWREKVAVNLIKSIVSNNDEPLLPNDRIMVYSYGY